MGILFGDFRRRQATFLLHMLFLPELLSMVSANTQAQNDITDAFFASSRIFQTTPTEGITLLSSTTTTSYLINGIAEDLIFEFVFMPPSGATPEQYEMAFQCDSNTVYVADDCAINNAVASIVGTSATAYNTSVNCAFAQFPGSTSCYLSATLKNTVRQTMDGELEVLPSIHQQVLYESERITNNVFGVVFYIPDSSGQLSDAATIISGTSNTYELSNYDRTDQGVREIATYGIIPGGSAATGTAGLDFYQSATVTAIAEDFILRYDPAICTLTNAAFSNGRLSLPSTSCSIGMAVQDESSYPKLGMQFRTYKSGKFSLQLTWPSLGTSTEPYEQTITFDIVEPAPPVISGLQSLPVYRSTPCEVETLTMTAYNVRYADVRQIIVSNSDSSSTVWSEVAGGLTYDAAEDVSTIVFESAGGLGNFVAFSLRASFGTENRFGVVIAAQPDFSLTLSFTQPPSLTSMFPSVTQVGGGDTITLLGSFDEFSADDFVYVGGFAVPGSEALIETVQVTDPESGTQTETGKLTFASPPLSALGRLYIYDVSIAVCAERSGSLALTYQVAPTLKISSSDSSTDATGAFVIPADGEAFFVAEVSGNNVGVEYIWKVFDSAGQEVSTDTAVTNSQIFVVLPSYLSSTTETYVLRAQVTNSLELSDTAEVQVVLQESTTEFVLVNVHEVETLTRSTAAVTLIQAHVTVESRVVPEIDLEWTYRSVRYVVNSTAPQTDSLTATNSVTGPTRLGLEFSIAQEDLIIGEQDVVVEASLLANPDINGTDKITLTVVPSPLRAIINDGINGTLLLTGTSLLLSGSNSVDPDVLQGEGDQTEGIAHEWFSCKKSMQPSFANDVEDCSSILPTELGVVNVTVTSDALLEARLDATSDPLPTYFSFGLRVTKGDRSAQSYLYFELLTVATPEKVPTLTGMEVVDNKGAPLDRDAINIFGDTIIQPFASDPLVEWSFDMSAANQRYLFSQIDTLKNGSGFISSRGAKSRLPMGFLAGSLDPATEYRVHVTTSASDTSIEAEYEILFTTSEVPKLSCTPPEIVSGLIIETKFTVSGQLSFEAQDIEYCFLLVASPTEKFSLGDGCSAVPFATFTFPREGNYSLECLARTASGYLVDNVTLDTTIALSTPAPSPGATTIEILTERLANLTQEITFCEAIRDDACLVSLIAVARDIATAVEAAVAVDSSAEALTLLENCKAYVARLTSLSETLAENTVFRPNQVAQSVDLSFYLSLVPASMFEQEETLYASLKQVESAVNSTETDQVDPVVSDEIVDKVSGIANLSLATAFNLGQSGSSRRRLLANEQITRSAYANVLFLTSTYIAQIRAQQEGCGFDGKESTELKLSLAEAQNITVPDFDAMPVEVHIKVSCTEDQISVPLKVATVENDICRSAISALEGQRVVVTVFIIPATAIEATGLVTDFNIVVTHCPYLELKGGGVNSIPARCFNFSIPMKPDGSEGIARQNLTAGTLENVVLTPPNVCTPDVCFNFMEDDLDDISFNSNFVQIRTQRQGLFIAGEIQQKAPDPFQDTTIEGLNLGTGNQIAVGASIGVVFVLVSVLVTWFVVTNVVVTAPDVPIATTWEYVERDMYGRAGVQDSQLEKISRVLPDGAAAPERGPRAVSKSSVVR